VISSFTTFVLALALLVFLVVLSAAALYWTNRALPDEVQDSRPANTNIPSNFYTPGEETAKMYPPYTEYIEPPPRKRRNPDA
jgi:hypothetical protein